MSYKKSAGVVDGLVISALKETALKESRRQNGPVFTNIEIGEVEVDPETLESYKELRARVNVKAFQDHISLLKREDVAKVIAEEIMAAMEGCG